MLRYLYRCALCLHPPGFRKRFGGEMLSIFDHAQGRVACLRLLLDATASLSRQWLLRPEFWSESPAAVQQCALHGTPSFSTIDPFHPRAVAVLPGLVLSVAIFSLTCVAIKYSWIHVLHIRIPEVRFERSSWTPATPTTLHEVPSGSHPENSAVNTSQSTVVPLPPSSVETREPSPSNNISQHSRRAPVLRTSTTRGLAKTLSAAKPQEASNSFAVSGSLAPAVVDDWNLNAAERQLVLDGVIENLQKYYVDPGTARRISDVLRDHENHGDYDAITDGQIFADLLTTQINEVSRDKYIVVVRTTAPASEGPTPASAAEVAQYRERMAESNCTFERIQILPHNIGYLKFNSFPDVSICLPVAAAALTKLNSSDAIIFDLRDNPGGYANMVTFIATYLFDRPTHLNDFYNRGENSTEESWTLAPVPGNKLADKPAFVLTSASTFSAAEAFSYDLKMLKRVTVVGETTSGRGHMGARHTIDDHFIIRIPGILVTNPISKANWEGRGVEPDVKVNAADALATAMKLALTRLQKK